MKNFERMHFYKFDSQNFFFYLPNIFIALKLICSEWFYRRNGIYRFFEIKYTDRQRVTRDRYLVPGAKDVLAPPLRVTGIFSFSVLGRSVLDGRSVARSQRRFGSRRTASVGNQAARHHVPNGDVPRHREAASF